MTDNDLEILKPLLNSTTKCKGEDYIWNGNEDPEQIMQAICLYCGATVDHIMMKTHKEDCSWILWWKAYNHLCELIKKDHENSKED